MQKVPYLFLALSAAFWLQACSSSGVSPAPVVVSAGPKPNSLGFSKPLSTNYRITQRFKPKKNRKHNGIDIAGKKGSPIFTVAPGRVVYQGRRFSGYGKMILIAHDKGISSLTPT